MVLLEMSLFSRSSSWRRCDTSVLAEVTDEAMLMAWREFVALFRHFVKYHLIVYYGASTFLIGGYPTPTPEGVPHSVESLQAEIHLLHHEHQHQLEG